jgi:Protein of unknown function (DUF1153)
LKPLDDFCREGDVERRKYIIGRDGTVFTMADLPSPNTKRWVIRRKAQIVTAVLGGLISLDDACARYRLTAEEFHSWRKSVERSGSARD